MMWLFPSYFRPLGSGCSLTVPMWAVAAVPLAALRLPNEPESAEVLVELDDRGLVQCVECGHDDSVEVTISGTSELVSAVAHALLAEVNRAGFVFDVDDVVVADERRLDAPHGDFQLVLSGLIRPPRLPLYLLGLVDLLGLLGCSRPCGRDSLPGLLRRLPGKVLELLLAIG